MRINVARRGSVLWRECSRLARQRYARDYDATIEASPDCFIASLDETEARTGGVTPIACAGITYGGAGPLLVDRYLGAPAAEVVAERTGSRCSVADLVEVGPLASTSTGPGLELLRLVPAMCWCHGAAFLLCTVTPALARTLDRLGFDFTPLAPATLSALPTDQRDRWGRYYETSPMAGYIDLRAFGLAFDQGQADQRRTGLTVAAGIGPRVAVGSGAAPGVGPGAGVGSGPRGGASLRAGATLGSAS